MKHENEHASEKPQSKDLFVNQYSTWLNPGTREFEEVKDYILTMLGYPSVTVEITDSQLRAACATAMRLWTKYYHGQEKYLNLDLFYYKKAEFPNDPDAGLDLTEFNIMEVRDIGFQKDAMFGVGIDPFFSPYTFFGQGNYSPMFGMGNGNSVGSFTTWQNLNEFFDLAKRMTGSNQDWQYNRVTKRLKIMPEPRCGGKSHRFVCAVCYQEPPLEQILGEDYFLRMCIAQVKMIVGTVRKKYSGVNLLGGGTVDTEIYNEGKEEWDKLVEELQKSEGIGQCFYLS